MLVRSAREAKGWSQEHLATAAGVSLRTVQRAEAGSRISPENTLAISAALEIEPTDLPAPSSVGSGTFPHLAAIRSELDRAIADQGEWPVWRKSDASPQLAATLRRLGLSPDADGYGEAMREVLRIERKLGRAEFAILPFGLVWGLSLPAIPFLICRLFLDVQTYIGQFCLLVGMWVALGAALAVAILRFEKVRRPIEPSSQAEMLSAGIVATDIRPVEAVVTQRFLWVARSVSGRVRVIRVGLDTVREVQVMRVEDGRHAATFHVGTLPWFPDSEETSFRLTRLGDDEVRWLERRFANTTEPVVWSPVHA